MGRLFWKFFFAFWLALLAASGGVGAAVWLHQRALNKRGQELASGPRAAFDDRGPGVPGSDLQVVFEPFFRGGAGVKTIGFGLGLAIARRAIEAHGGSIRALNRPDGGLRVEIVLPVGDRF